MKFLVSLHGGRECGRATFAAAFVRFEWPVEVQTTGCTSGMSRQPSRSLKMVSSFFVECICDFA